jgi:hypothetical protein
MAKWYQYTENIPLIINVEQITYIQLEMDNKGATLYMSNNHKIYLTAKGWEDFQHRIFGV